MQTVFAEYLSGCGFLCREDEWAIPHEKFSDDSQEMEPYYTIIWLPGEQSEEFI